MIGRIRGIVLEKEPPLVVLEIGGIGYEIHMPITCFYGLPDTGKEAIVFTQLIVRNDTQLLYGFNNKQEQILFRELIRTNGIGPKIALSILSGMSAKQFSNIIKHDDLTALIKLSGIGRKTAERLILEMKSRFKNLHADLFTLTADLVLTTRSPAVSSTNIDNSEKEAISALIALGYKPREASQMVNKVATPNVSSETLIRKALHTTLRGKNG